MDDRDAIRLCKAGDGEAYRHLVTRYQAEAIGHARAILGGGQDAADAAQEAFYAAFQALGRFDEDRRFYPWFYTILRNRCLKFLARTTARRSTSLDDVGMIAASPGLPPEDRLTLETALLDLAAEDREILTLRHFDGLSYAELASLLEIPQGTVMSRLFNARRRLRDRLEPAARRREENTR
jgi:RNA polymerase sigma-70 factor, ECF subfamily